MTFVFCKITVFSLLPDNWMCLHDLAKAGYCAIQKETGKKYRIGSVASLIKNAKKIGGGSVDYAHKTVKIPFTICLELSGGSFKNCLNNVAGRMLNIYIFL